MGLEVLGEAAMTISNGIPNLFAVEQNILRGGQPSDVGWTYLKSQGITDVIKLNTDEEGLDPERMGFVIHKFPIPWWRQTIWHPTSKSIHAAVDLVKVNTFIHCEHGLDRSGLIVACFRVWKQQWKKQDAEDEMLAYEFHKALRGLWEFWEDKVP